MIRPKGRRFIGAMMAAVLIAGSLHGAGTGAARAVGWEGRSTAAEATVTGGQGWMGWFTCVACAGGSIAASVVSGPAAALGLFACGVVCGFALDDEH